MHDQVIPGTMYLVVLTLMSISEGSAKSHPLKNIGKI
jgi:hypothetical protein